MFTEKDLRELLEFSAPDPVLSVYLNTEPSGGNADAYKLRLRTMLKEVKLPQDIEEIERYFNQSYDWSGRSVAVFSCAPADFFRTYPLAIPVNNMVQVSDRPSVKPLADLMENYGGYGVVLVDRQGARTFHFHLGELREQEGVLGESVKRTKHGGASSMPGRRGGTAGKTRAVEETVERNMKEAAEFAVRFFEDAHVRRILIGGTDDNITAFRGELPKAWQSLIMGTFPMSMTASHHDVLTRTLEVGTEAERQREEKLVKSIITAAAKGSNATVGLEDTLKALNDSRIQTLVVADDFHEKGYYCQNCGLMTARMVDNCPSCDGNIETIGDVIEAAVNAVLRRKGEVEVVHENQTLENVGKIGALLRF